LNGFPYSYFYQYFEQYLTITSDTITLLISAFGKSLFQIIQYLSSSQVVISVVLFLFILSPIPTLLDCLVIAMVLIDDMGFMYFWGVDLNAISLVNRN
jgi:multidrug efflux pump subunit AcrB